MYCAGGPARTSDIDIIGVDLLSTTTFVIALYQIMAIKIISLSFAKIFGNLSCLFT